MPMILSFPFMPIDPFEMLHTGPLSPDGTFWFTTAQNVKGVPEQELSVHRRKSLLCSPKSGKPSMFTVSSLQRQILWVYRHRKISFLIAIHYLSFGTQWLVLLIITLFLSPVAWGCRSEKCILNHNLTAHISFSGLFFRCCDIPRFSQIRCQTITKKYKEWKYQRLLKKSKTFKPLKCICTTYSAIKGCTEYRTLSIYYENIKPSFKGTL